MSLAPEIEQAYRDLDLEPGADLNQVKQAYHRLAKAFHPDLHPGTQGLLMQRINRAYQTLASHLRAQEPVNGYVFQEFQDGAPRRGARTFSSFFHRAARSAGRAADTPESQAQGPLAGPDGAEGQRPQPQDSPSLGPLSPDPDPSWRLLGIVNENGTLVYRTEVRGRPSVLTLPLRRQRPCRQCKGTGLYITRRGRHRHCPACGGRGRLTYSDQVTVNLPQDWTPGQVIEAPAAEGGEIIRIQLMAAPGKEA
jgi:DnaJ-class molecular chaperone